MKGVLPWSGEAAFGRRRVNMMHLALDLNKEMLNRYQHHAKSVRYSTFLGRFPLENFRGGRQGSPSPCDVA